MQTIGVRIRKDTNFAVTQLAQIFTVRIDADRYRNIVHFLRCKHFIGRYFPGIKDLTFQRHDRLVFAVARLLGRAAGGISFHKKQFGPIQILSGAIRQLAGKGRTASELFTHHFFRRSQTTLGAGNRHFRQQLRRLDVLV